MEYSEAACPFAELAHEPRAELLCLVVRLALAKQTLRLAHAHKYWRLGRHVPATPLRKGTGTVAAVKSKQVRCSLACGFQVLMVRGIQSASRNLCHRQLSWFRDEPLFQWVDAAREPSAIVEDIVAALANDSHKGVSRGSSSKPPCMDAMACNEQLPAFQHRSSLSGSVSSFLSNPGSGPTRLRF